MASKTPATDPLAGLPAAGPSKPRAVKTSGAPAASGNVVNLTAAKAARKRKRLTGDQFKQARDFARSATGYGNTSPIWGKKMIEVLTSIETNLAQGIEDVLNGHASSGVVAVEKALLFNRELQKRIATNQIISAQR